MRKGAKRYGREPLPFSENLLTALGEHSWPGNLRELENVINRYLVLGEERSIIEELSPSTVYQGAGAAAGAALGAAAAGSYYYGQYGQQCGYYPYPPCY